ncbi:hypothetical protein U1Q18_043688 [Sarracenia purpurea var. burkii]
MQSSQPPPRSERAYNETFVETVKYLEKAANVMGLGGGRGCRKCNQRYEYEISDLHSLSGFFLAFFVRCEEKAFEKAKGEVEMTTLPRHRKYSPVCTSDRNRLSG